MRKILLILLIINFLFINNSFGSYVNKGCSGPIYRPFDRIILFDKFNGVNTPRIIDYHLDNDKKKKLDNILHKVSDDNKAIFLINIEKIFKKKLDKYSKNIIGYSKGGYIYYTKTEIGKIKLLYSLNFYFSGIYNKFDKLKDTIVSSDEVILNNGVKLSIKKVYNIFIPKLNCIQIYDGYSDIFESNDFNKGFNFDIKVVNNNIFYITYKKVGISSFNKNLIKIYHIGLGRLTTQDPFYMKIININDNKIIINQVIGDYVTKLKL